MANAISAIELGAAARKAGIELKPAALRAIARVAELEGYTPTTNDPTIMGAGIGTTNSSFSKAGVAHLNSGKPIGRPEAAYYMLDHYREALKQAGVGFNDIPDDMALPVFDYLYRYPAKYIPKIAQFGKDPVALKKSFAEDPITEKDFPRVNIEKNPGVKKRNDEILGALVGPQPNLSEQSSKPNLSAIQPLPKIKPPMMANEAFAQYKETMGMPQQQPPLTPVQPVPVQPKPRVDNSADRAEMYHDLLNPAVSPQAFLDKVMKKRGLNLFAADQTPDATEDLPQDLDTGNSEQSQLNGAQSELDFQDSTGQI